MNHSWVACAEPEREPDPFILWHYTGCKACAVKASAQRSRFPQDPHVVWLDNFINAGGAAATAPPADATSPDSPEAR